jgi:hypothetical protein
MKKSLLVGLLMTLVAHTGFATCNPTVHRYLSEEDDNGIVLPLSLACTSDHGEVCIYIGDNLADITGLPISTGDLYRQNISNKFGTLNISLKSEAGIASVIDFKSVEVEINNTSLSGTVEYGSHGVDPFKGIIYKPTRSINLQCSLAN